MIEWDKMVELRNSGRRLLNAARASIACSPSEPESSIDHITGINTTKPRVVRICKDPQPSSSSISRIPCQWRRRDTRGILSRTAQTASPWGTWGNTAKKSTRISYQCWLRTWLKAQSICYQIPWPTMLPRPLTMAAAFWMHRSYKGGHSTAATAAVPFSFTVCSETV